MLSRLVLPIGFVVGLAALVFVVQSLGSAGSSTNQAPATASDLLKQFAIVEVAPIEATVSDRDGKKLALPGLFTKPTILTFWSVNCGECEIGLPVLNDFAHNQTKLAVVLVDTKDSPKDAQTKLDSLKVTLLTYYDGDGSAFEAWEATMPSSYYIANNKVSYFFPGRVANDHLQALLSIQP